LTRPTAIFSWLTSLTRKHTFPREITIFGTTQDGKPVFLQLNDPRTGAILVCGSRPATTILLQTVCHSALALNGAQAGVAVITAHPECWEQTERMTVFSSAAPINAILRFIQEAETGIVLFLVEDYRLVASRSEAFQFICKHGPEKKVWTICSAERLSDVPASLFPTRIFETSQRYLFGMKVSERAVFFHPPTEPRRSGGD
jgi:hypothetical protein